MQLSTSTDIPKIKGIPEIPGARSIVGHLLKPGDDHASVCEDCFKTSIFQIRLGNTRAVVVNSFEDCRRMLIGHQFAVIDRPKLYTFHGVISSTQGFTIGSPPWDGSCRNKRKAAGQTLGRVAIKTYYPMFDLETCCIVGDLIRDSNGGTVFLSIRPYLQRYALNTTLTLCYGIRMDSLRARRDKYLNDLLYRVREMIEKGDDKPCVSAAILKVEETKLSGVEVSLICFCIGSLSTPEGQKFQQRAYEDILRHHPTVEDAWSKCLEVEGIPYINAIVKEAERYYTVSSMSLPREAYTDIQWNGATIPKATMILINAQAANHEPENYGPDAGTFNPERWLSTTSPPEEIPAIGIQHFSFGAGSCACSGQYIASRLLYTALVRLICSFQFVASENEPPNTDYMDYNQFKSALVATPRDFKDQKKTFECVRAAERRTEDSYT
ncbi:hypothetical protein M433DRAFT_143849 [Acidomyces richmondensis BFW]|nr:hypothetical protein M433DRAFT_143849 [Acidomyces richmondensis BFW]